MKENEIRSRTTLNTYLDMVRQDAINMFQHRPLQVVPCPACLSSDFLPEIDKWVFEYVRCRDCGTVYVNPRPEFADLMEFYRASPSAKYWVNEFFMPMSEARREKIFRPRAQELDDELPELATATIGDIGAGFGLFAEELAKVWPKAKIFAIEPEPEMVAICREKGVKVLPSAMEEVEGWDESFDLLTAFELFEHLHQPELLFNKARSLLRPGGYLLITTLNFQGFDLQILGAESKMILPPAHLNFFNPYSVKLLLERTGFELVSLTTPGKLDVNIVENAVREENFSLDGFLRHLLDLPPEAKAGFQKWLVDNNQSSHMRILARKQ